MYLDMMEGQVAGGEGGGEEVKIGRKTAEGGEEEVEIGSKIREGGGGEGDGGGEPKVS